MCLWVASLDYVTFKVILWFHAFADYNNSSYPIGSHNIQNLWMCKEANEAGMRERPKMRLLVRESLVISGCKVTRNERKRCWKCSPGTQ